MLLDILTYPDPRLRLKAAPVAGITDEIRRLAEDMTETMYKAPGVGLAAPQVGRSLRMLVMNPSGPETPEDLRVFVNPELALLGERILSPKEGCLSVPLDYRADVMRHERVLVRAQSLDGAVLEEEWEGFPAIVLQHEFDHLEGFLFIDHISRLRRSLFDARVKKCLKRGND